MDLLSKGGRTAAKVYKIADYVASTSSVDAKTKTSNWGALTNANFIADGATNAGAGTVTTLVKEKPTKDIPVVWMLRTEV